MTASWSCTLLIVSPRLVASLHIYASPRLASRQLIRLSMSRHYRYVVAFEDSKVANLDWGFGWGGGLIDDLLQDCSDLRVACASKLVSSGLGCSFGGEGDFDFCSFEAAFSLLF